MLNINTKVTVYVDAVPQQQSSLLSQSAGKIIFIKLNRFFNVLELVTTPALDKIIEK